MDLSKLPRLSGDNQPDAQSKPTSAQQQVPEALELPPAIEVNIADAWLSAAVGAILMMLGWEFVQWLAATLAGRVHDTRVKWLTGEKAGQMTPYWEITGHQALSESAMFLFGFVLVLEAISMLVAAKWPRIATPLIAGTVLLTGAMTLYNLIAVIALMRDGTVPVISMLAVAFGGYAVLSAWRVLAWK